VKLLVAYYWYPYNSWGTFRWWNFAKYIDLDVLTSRKPKGAFYDPTIEKRGQTIYRHSSLPATVWGLYITIYLLFIIRKYEMVIFTSPPETLLIAAWLCQSLGKLVVVDMRDAIDNPIKPHLKFARPIFRWFYRGLKYRTTCWNFQCEGDEFVVRHGYYELKKSCYDNILSEGKFFPLWYETWLQMTRCGIIKDYRWKPKGYGSSSFVNYLHLGFKNLPRHFHDEVHEQTPYSWKEQAGKMKKYLESLTNKK
jgi:hypothetical protein